MPNILCLSSSCLPIQLFLQKCRLRRPENIFQTLNPLLLLLNGCIHFTFLAGKDLLQYSVSMFFLFVSFFSTNIIQNTIFIKSCSSLSFISHSHHSFYNKQFNLYFFFHTCVQKQNITFLFANVSHSNTLESF